MFIDCDVSLVGGVQISCCMFLSFFFLLLTVLPCPTVNKMALGVTAQVFTCCESHNMLDWIGLQNILK